MDTTTPTPSVVTTENDSLNRFEKEFEIPHFFLLPEVHFLITIILFFFFYSHFKIAGLRSKSFLLLSFSFYWLALITAYFLHSLIGRHESDFIQKIVKEISNKLNQTFLDVAKNPVGLDSHVHGMSMLLNIGCDDVRMVGVHGIGGIGKTTVAKAVYNLISNQFEGSSFVANVREISEQYGLVRLQEILLSEILGDVNVKVGNVDRGINVIRDRLRHRKVLLVLDDVNKLGQLEKLAGDKNWFGPGSRIIITTRDRHVLDAHCVETIYKVTELSHDDALQLFSWNAFKKSSPAKNYEELANCVVKYAKGLPLVLVVLGSFLCGRSEPQWKSTICKLQRSLDKEVYEMLKISFDGLENHEKAIFLDIACFFNGEGIDYVTKILEGCDFYPVIGIQVLIEKSLINVEKNKLQMHDLLQLMGRDIVYQESPNDPGKRSRLWFDEDVLYILTENTGTNAVEGIKLNLLEQEDVLLSSSKAFTKMKRLRLLIVRNAQFSKGPINMSNELRLLDWPRYPSPSMPSNFHPKKLVALNMPRSKIKQLEGFKVFENLKYMNFSYCESLTSIPDFSTISNLENLILTDCKSLVEVHQSVGFLDKLVVLNLAFCSNLISLPSNLKLTCLQRLVLKGCTRLEKFPNIEGKMARLREIKLQETAIKELPSSVEYLVGLQVIELGYCKNLVDLPSSISKLPCLNTLFLSGCSNLRKLPKSCSSNDELPSCSDLLPSSSLNKTLDSSLSVNSCTPLGFPVLISLDLKNCNLSEVDFLFGLGCFSTLKSLKLSGNHFVSLPASLSKFTKLLHLEMENCERLRKIPEFPPEFPRYINASGCKSLIENNGNNMANLLSNERFCGESQIDIILPGSNLPDWLCHHNTEDSISFQVPSHLYAKFAGLVVCSILRSDVGALPNCSCEIQVSVNDDRVRVFEQRFNSLNSDHVWLRYVPRRSLWNLDELLSKNEWSHFEFSVRILSNEKLLSDLDFFEASLFEYIELPTKESLKRWGVHLVCEQDEKANDPRVIQHYCPTQNDSIEKSVDPIEEIQLTKRRLEDYNYDDHLENNCCQRQKRHCGGLGVRLSGTDNVRGHQSTLLNNQISEGKIMGKDKELVKAPDLAPVFVGGLELGFGLEWVLGSKFSHKEEGKSKKENKSLTSDETRQTNDWFAFQ